MGGDRPVCGAACVDFVHAWDLPGVFAYGELSLALSGVRDPGSGVRTESARTCPWGRESERTVRLWLAVRGVRDPGSGVCTESAHTCPWGRESERTVRLRLAVRGVRGQGSGVRAHLSLGSRIELSLKPDAVAIPRPAGD